MSGLLKKMLCKRILITGCNRGLGLEMVRQLAGSKDPPQLIIAACRKPAEATELNEIAKSAQMVRVIKYDASKEDSCDAVAEEVTQLAGDEGLNLLINNAGMSHKSTRINMVKWEQMTEALMINTTAPLMLTKALLPLLRMAGRQGESSSLRVNRAAVINMSSLLGSIQDNQQGGLYPYRASKAALNAVTKSLSLDLRSDNILVTSFHPGWVQTDMGGKNAPLTPSESISTLLATLQTLTEEHTGCFLRYNGQHIPW